MKATFSSPCGIAHSWCSEKLKQYQIDAASGEEVPDLALPSNREKEFPGLAAHSDKLPFPATTIWSMACESPCTGELRQRQAKSCRRRQPAGKMDTIRQTQIIALIQSSNEIRFRVTLTRKISVCLICSDSEDCIGRVAFRSPYHGGHRHNPYPSSNSATFSSSGMQEWRDGGVLAGVWIQVIMRKSKTRMVQFSH